MFIFNILYNTLINLSWSVALYKNNNKWWHILSISVISSLILCIILGR